MTSLQSVDPQKLGIEEETWVHTWMSMIKGIIIDFSDGLGGDKNERDEMQGEIIDIERHLIDDMKN